MIIAKKWGTVHSAVKCSLENLCLRGDDQAEQVEQHASNDAKNRCDDPDCKRCVTWLTLRGKNDADLKNTVNGDEIVFFILDCRRRKQDRSRRRA